MQRSYSLHLTLLLIALVACAGCLGDIDFDSIQPQCEGDAFDLATRDVYCSGSTRALDPVDTAGGFLVGIANDPSREHVFTLTADIQGSAIETLTLGVQTSAEPLVVPGAAAATLALADVQDPALALTLGRMPARVRLLDTRGTLVLLHYINQVVLLQVDANGDVVAEPELMLFADDLLNYDLAFALVGDAAEDATGPLYLRTFTRALDDDTLALYIPGAGGLQIIKLTWDGSRWNRVPSQVPRAYTDFLGLLCIARNGIDTCLTDEETCDDACQGLEVDDLVALGCSRCGGCDLAEGAELFAPECVAFCAELDATDNRPATAQCTQAAPALRGVFLPYVCLCRENNDDCLGHLPCEECDVIPGVVSNDEACEGRLFRVTGTVCELCGDCDASSAADPRCTDLCQSIRGDAAVTAEARCEEVAQLDEAPGLLFDTCVACDSCAPGARSQSETCLLACTSAAFLAGVDLDDEAGYAAMCARALPSNNDESRCAARATFSLLNDDFEAACDLCQNLPLEPGHPNAPICDASCDPFTDGGELAADYDRFSVLLQARGDDDGIPVIFTTSGASAYDASGREVLFVGSFGQIAQITGAALNELDPDVYASVRDARGEDDDDAFFQLGEAGDLALITLPSINQVSPDDLGVLDLRVVGDALFAIVVRAQVFSNGGSAELGDLGAMFLVRFALNPDGTIARDVNPDTTELPLTPSPNGRDPFPLFTHLVDLGNGLLGVRTNIYDVSPSCVQDDACSPDAFQGCQISPNGRLIVFDVTGPSTIELPVVAEHPPGSASGISTADFHRTDIAAQYNPDTQTTTVLFPYADRVERLDLQVIGDAP